MSRTYSSEISEYASIWMTPGMSNACPVRGVSLKKESSLVRRVKTAPKLAPDEGPATIKPLLNDAENWVGLLATCNEFRS